jgi:hypothetical protein
LLLNSAIAVILTEIATPDGRIVGKIAGFGRMSLGQFWHSTIFAAVFDAGSGIEHAPDIKREAASP